MFSNIPKPNRINLKQLLLLCASLVMLGSQVSGQALTQQQVNVLNQGIYYFNTEASTCSVALGSTSLLGSDNVQKAFNYFVQKGLTPAQSAGIVGNLMQESGVDPSREQTSGGNAKGIAQWEGSRYDALVAFAQQQGKPWTDLGVQLDYLWQELTTTEQGALTALKGASTAAAAAQAFEENFERAGSPNMPARIQNAEDVLAKYGNGTVSGSGASAVTSSNNGCNPTGTGQNTKFIDGFTIYSQCDPTWANKPFGGDNICGSGCGPTAMAMIITALTGSPVTPDVTAAYATTANEVDDTGGSKWTIGPDLAAHWGLHAEQVGTDIAKISATLQAGGLVITSGKGPLPFTSGGHYIVIRGVTANGKWKIGDPGHTDTNTEEWDPQQLVASGMQAGSTYAITK